MSILGMSNKVAAEEGSGPLSIYIPLSASSLEEHGTKYSQSEVQLSRMLDSPGKGFITKQGSLEKGTISKQNSLGSPTKMCHYI